MPRDFAHVPGGELWVFAYGSLMWRPGFDFAEKRLARVFGFHRSLCISSHHHRGTPERPGLALGLDRGGCCWGLALRATAATAEAALAYLWEREMIGQVYRPLALTVYDPAGSAFGSALAFVVRRSHPQYCGGLSDAEAAERLRICRGTSGGNLEYLAETVQGLERIGVPDRHLTRLLRLATAGAGIEAETA